MVKWLEYFNLIVFILFFCCYAYQFVYIGVRLFTKPPVRTAKKMHKFAVLIAARNESKVIGELIESIKSQNYPRGLVDIFVVADNCTDDTAAVARKYGAVAFVRNNLEEVGKSFALNYAFERIEDLCGISNYEGYFVFDADNVLDTNYIKEMNAVFDDGYRVVTIYRNSKNYGFNWISAGYALWFLRESKYLNGARMQCHTSCAISGTGFLVSSEIIHEDGGWKYNLMTEDIEFSTDKIIHGDTIGYCEAAILYDEQPVDFKTSWNQRMRWTKGFYQVIHNYGCKLFRGCWSKKGFQCYDMLATIVPAVLLTILMFLVNVVAIAHGLIDGNYPFVTTALYCIWASLRNMFLTLFFFGLITTITEWKQIHCSTAKKIFYMFTFPVFMFTYLPIAIDTLIKYKKIIWIPVEHTFVGTMSEISRYDERPNSSSKLVASSIGE